MSQLINTFITLYNKECLLWFTIMVFFVSCTSSHTEEFTYQDVDTINLDQSHHLPKLKYSDFSKDPQIIILETKPECIIKNIKYLELYNNHIYILDDDANALYVFDFNGKYLHQIGDRGAGRGEFLEVSDFSIDRQNKVICLWDDALDRLNKYDLTTGKFISSVQIQRDGYRSYNMQYLDNTIFLSRSSLEQSKDNYEIIKVNGESGLHEARFINSDEHNNGWNLPLQLINSMFYCKNTNEPKYIGMFSNKVFSITPDGIKLTYFIESKDFATKSDVSELIQKYLDNNHTYEFSEFEARKRIYQISNFTDIGDQIYFLYIHGIMRRYVIYNKTKKDVKIYDMIVNDYISDKCYLPMGVHACEGNSVLTILPHTFMDYFKTEIIDKGELKKDIDKYEELIKLDESSNPVLFCHELKE